MILVSQKGIILKYRQDQWLSKFTISIFNNMKLVLIMSCTLKVAVLYTG